MGEYARYGGKRIKIGTCEDMYYLRADQALRVSRETNSLDPNDQKVQHVIRFRFPWPDEDRIRPGDFGNYKRSIIVEVAPPKEVAHKNPPCPFGEGCRAAKIVQQGYRNGHLATILECVGCGAKWAAKPEEVVGIVQSLKNHGKWGAEIAKRIEDGYLTASTEVEMAAEVHAETRLS